MTNYEVITQDENSLSTFLVALLKHEIVKCECCAACIDYKRCRDYADCKDGICDWLKKEQKI